MGERDTRRVEGDNATATGNARSTSSASTSSGTTGRGRNAAGKQDEKNHELAVLKNKPKTVSIEVPGSTEKATETKKKRGRPPGSTKKKTTTKKASIDDNQVTVLLVTIFGIVASKPGMSAFMLTVDEASQISKPLCSILSKNDGVAAAAGEYADHIALAFACMTILIPKFLIWKSERDDRKEKEQHELKTRTATTDAQQSTRQTRHSTNTENVTSQFNGEFNSILAPII